MRHLSTEDLRGLTKVDAEKVVSAWALFGKEGLKTLDGLQFEMLRLDFLPRQSRKKSIAVKAHSLEQFYRCIGAKGSKITSIVS